MSDSNPVPDEQVIVDQSDLRKYRTELPNLYDDADLDVYEFRLLAHYKRVGICREGLPTTALKCKMSEGQISQKRQSLADKGWVTLERISMDKGRYRFVVRVVDRWIENFSRFSGLSIDEITKQVKKGSPSPHEGSPSPHEGKKELIKNLDIRFSTIAKKLESLTGSLNAKSADLIDTWTEKHTDEWIFKAFQMAEDNGAIHQNYVDRILIGWEANGYPKTRDEKIQGAKNEKSRAGSRKNKSTDAVDYSQADIDIAAEINAAVR